ncbi:uncharacterized protein METZ01_LOCUS118732, partial [marine metagenome]
FYVGRISRLIKPKRSFLIIREKLKRVCCFFNQKRSQS